MSRLACSACCGPLDRRPALSRRGLGSICSPCGGREAAEDAGCPPEVVAQIAEAYRSNERSHGNGPSSQRTPSTSRTPSSGDTVLLCLHHPDLGDAHYFLLQGAGCAFRRPNGSVGIAAWIAMCDSCFPRYSERAHECPCNVDVLFPHDVDVKFVGGWRAGGDLS